jgi:hypothetical protein
LNRFALPRFWVVLLLGGLLAWTTLRSVRRFQEERADQRVLILADWYEARDLAARTGQPDRELLRGLQQNGAQGLLLSALTLSDLQLHHRVTPHPASKGEDPLDTRELIFHETNLAQQTQRELQWHGVSDVTLRARGSAFLLSRRAGSSFLSLKDVELGLDPLLVDESRALGLSLFIRLNRDPWTTPAQIGQMLQEDMPVAMADGIVFNSDELPGGPEALPLWQNWLRDQHPIQALFEFHASRAARMMARQVPAFVCRSHSIPSSELKDLPPGAELARWRRAVQERSCRILLFHASPNDAWPTYLSRLNDLHNWLQRDGWATAIPAGHPVWRATRTLQRWGMAFFAFWAASVAPLIGLVLVGGKIRRGSRGSRSPLTLFWTLSLLTVLGALVVAALADRPEMRLQLTPFPGVKISFLLSWFGSIFVLYEWKEIRAFLVQGVRRFDVVLGVIFLAIVAYILIRSGNASGGWMPFAEQGIRDRLEEALIARPRFKEFLWGHPLLIAGFWLSAVDRSKKLLLDGRPWIVLGMVGQASIVNTFCHLHSPLSMALMRTVNGALIGSILGWLLVRGLAGVRRRFKL